MQSGVLVLVGVVAFAMPATAGLVTKAAVVDALIRDGQLSKTCVREDPPKEALIEVRMQDLNDDGVPEYLVEGNFTCACAAQKCYHWVYTQAGRTLRLIMAAQGDHVDISAERTNGYSDLVVTYVYRGDVAKTTLRFKGASYTETPRMYD